MISIGLTGGIGAGKSLALREFARKGAATVSSDELSHEALRPGTAAARTVLREFGTLDRKALARIVFSDARKRRRLEAILHPEVLAGVRARARKARGVFVADVPLLFEAGVAGRFDLTVLVAAPREKRIARVRARDGATRADVLRRLKAQWSQERKERLADVVIANDRRPEDFRRKVAEYYQAFRLIEAAQR